MSKVATSLNLFESLASRTSSTSVTELAKATKADALLLSEYTFPVFYLVSPILN